MAKKIIRLTEADLTRLVRRVINEQSFGGNSQNAVKQIMDSCRSVELTNANTNQIVDAIYKAIQGAGTDEGAIIGALKLSRDLNTFCTAAANYRRTYGVDLYSDLDGDIDQESVWVEISKVLRDLQQVTSQSPQQVAKPSGKSNPVRTGNPQPRPKR